MSWLKRLTYAGIFAAALSPWYYFTHQSLSQKKVEEKYTLPAEISVVASSVPIHETKDPTSENTLEKIIYTSEINFSGHFDIRTERYHLVKDDDWIVSQVIGLIGSLPAKLLFFDFKVGAGMDAERSKAVLAILEGNENIKDVTVRINHNRVWHDCFRLTTDKKVTERNNWIARYVLGVPTSILSEIFSELTRGDYYHSLNQTVVLYSNIEGIAGHEIGHHLDYQRFSSDWEYGLTKFMPPVMIFQELQASLNSKDIISKEDQGQFERYLLPALMTYCVAGWFVSRRMVQKRKLKGEGYSDELIRKMKAGEKPKVPLHHTFRHFITENAALYGGIAAYHAGVANGVPELLTYVGFAVGMLATEKTLEVLGSQVLPYFSGEEEKQLRFLTKWFS